MTMCNLVSNPGTVTHVVLDGGLRCLAALGRVTDPDVLAGVAHAMYDPLVLITYHMCLTVVRC